MYQHDESSSTDVINAPREADEQDGRYVVNNLLLEVLERMKTQRVTTLHECVSVQILFEG